jgi:RNA polymerase sigma factor (sigma-70 family)
MASAAVGTAFQHLRDLFGTGTATGLADGQLLARFASENDAVAFEALVARYGPMVLATCRAVLKNEQDAEDAFQTTFLVLAKKAGSIRGGEVLGGWLHRVAYRAAVQVSVEAKKRRRKEAEASAMVLSSATRSDHEPGSDFDLRSLLHAEIDRLPERQRLPVVLCDLEGLTYDQAADRLRWTVPALRCRLARARQRLKGRLTRRGFVAPALGAVLAGEGARAAVPPLLIRSTVLAATGGPASAGVLLATHAILRGMLMTKLKFATTAALAALALASAGVIAAGGPRADDAKSAMKPKAHAATAAVEKPVPNTPVEMVEIKGRVVAPDGRPVAGALVTTLYMDTEILSADTRTGPWPKTSSGSDGRFAIRLPQTKLAPSIEGYISTEPWLVASAPGYAFGWCQRGRITRRPAEQVIRLVEEGPPIEGRIVDLEGRPVVGASVEAHWIWYEGKGDLAGWIAKARNGAAGNLWQGLQRLATGAVGRKSGQVPRERLIPIVTTTGADGRFKLTGVGRDRIAELMVSGPGIATTQAYVFSRPEREIRDVDKGMMRRQPFIVHAPNFQLALPPGIRVQGTIRDNDSGRPIAGLEIQAAVFDEHSRIPDPGIEAITDSDGKYRLDGLSKAAAYQLFIKVSKGLPYTNTTRKVPAQSPGLEPVTFDTAMKRGVVVRGKATDKMTGRPMKGTVNYFAFADNPHVRQNPGFSESHDPYAPIDEQGRYEVVALPGRGIIAVRDEMDQYRPATGYEKIAGYDAKHQYMNTVPEMIIPGSHAIIAEVNLDPKVESITLDLQGDSGIGRMIEVVGPDGAPIGGTKAKGVGETYQTSPMPQPSSSIEVHALDPSKPRRVVVMHEARKLIGTALMKGTETGPVTIKLQPWGSVAGRIVDDEGRPRKAMFIGSPDGNQNKHPETYDILPGSDWNSGVRVGDDGRFKIEGLVPGLKYSANARTGFEAYGDLFVDLTVSPGEAKELGDLKVQPPKKEEE